MIGSAVRRAAERVAARSGPGSSAAGPLPSRRDCADGRGDRCVGVAPERCAGRAGLGVIGGVQRGQPGRQHVEAFAAVPAWLGDAGGDGVDHGGAQQVGVVGDERVGQRRGVPLLAAVDRPDQRVVASSRIRRRRLPVR